MLATMHLANPHRLANALNQSCDCIGADVPILQRRLSDRLTTDLPASLAQTHAHLFSATPLFLSDEHGRQMRELVTAVERVAALPAYQELALRNAPAVARHAQGTRGVFLGFDFHIADDGPKLIEINTNAGGALLNLELIEQQLQCCPEAKSFAVANDTELLALELLQMFSREWALARGNQPLRHIAIMDVNPTSQYLFPEFVLFKRLFERAGIKASIVSPDDISIVGTELVCDREPIDLIYNRSTDFYLQDASHAHVREAYLSNQVVLTPHPRSHALYANKRNLTVLSDEAALRDLNVDADTIQVLVERIPRTEQVSSGDAERWWTQRKNWFFKPAGGYGSRGVYRGAKMTRSVFASVVQGDYIAQRLVVPSERSVQSGLFKVDVRNYAYQGHVHLVAARLYQGQTTNFRTPGGGFAPVFFASDHRETSTRDEAISGSGCTTR